MAIMEVIAQSTPEDILDSADKNLSLLQMSDESWKTRVIKLVRIVHRFHQEDVVISKLDDITLPVVLAEVYKMASEENNQQCIETLNFISNSRTCLRWLQQNIEEIKNDIRLRLVKI